MDPSPQLTQQHQEGSASEPDAAPSAQVVATDIANNDSLEKSSSAQAMILAADTASASSGVNESNIDDDDFDEDDDPMPLMNYTRLTGSIPRISPPDVPGERGSGSTVGPLSDRCRCSALGKVILDPETTSMSAETGGGSISSSLDLMNVQRVSSSGGDDTTADGTARNNGANGGLDPQRPELFLSSDLWKQPHYVMALGFGTGKISLLNVRTGISVTTQQLKVREGWASGGNNSTGPPIVDLSFDSSGTFLAAIDAEGACAIWELKYAPSVTTPEQQDSSSTAQTTATSAASQTMSRTQPSTEGGMFSSFMTALTGVPPTSGEASTSTAPETSETLERASKMIPSLTATVVQVSRITYPKSFGTPTTLALDPAHKKRREKSLVVGFANGQLVLTRRGFFQRRTDSVLYQGASKTDEKIYRGIEAIAWRGSLVAWADASGIKLLEVDNLTRIAHIDRPTGARPTLYPTISSLRPSLQFETSSTLLVAWGDCLMTMTILEVQTAPVGSAMTGLDGGGGQPASVKRRAVECTMAWELDCVACGAVPLDEDNVVVLGLVPPVDDDDDGELPEQATNEVSNQGGNDLEIQIVSRKDGAIVYSDSLPILRKPPSPSGQNKQASNGSPGNMAESAISYNLLSSFALSRMDDAFEVVEDQIGPDMDPNFDLNVPLFATSELGQKSFRDNHRDWSLKSVMFDYDDKLRKEGSVEKEINCEETNDDSLSVDSDDYAFVIEPFSESELVETVATPPPILVVASSSDVILSRMADVDDAIAHALAKNKRGLALRRALYHKRQLRRYDLGDLVSNYLEAVLRINCKGTEPDLEPSPLSLRRMTLAVQSMPALFGGSISLWERWTREIENVPGAVFLLRDHLPVRDPILPSMLYERVLETMLKEAEMLSTSFTEANKDTISTSASIAEAQDLFLSTLIAWGPTKVLKEYIKLFRSIRERRKEGSSQGTNDLRNAEILLQRRYLQTAAGYLTFPVGSATGLSNESQPSLPRFESNNDDSRNSLFDPSVLLKKITAVDSLRSGEAASLLDISSLPSTSRMSLDAIARLRMMTDRYELALQCFLAIGDLHSSISLDELESAAIEEVNNPTSRRKGQQTNLVDGASYEYVLDVIDFHTLHQFLLNEEFVGPAESKFSPPLFALLRLLGLDLVGDFLINYCVVPAVEIPSRAPATQEVELDYPVRRATLPIDKVAKQLERSPKLMHWYLHKVFKQKPDLYVKFPNTANPPKAVIDLHRRHFGLYIEFGERDTVKSLQGTEAYKVEAVTTPLLSFLQAALPLGGITPVAARRTLESYRSRRDNAEDEEASSLIDRSHFFALELAFIIEHYSDETEAEAKGILDLYLEGADSVVLAVSYAQRQRQHSAALWEKLISYCLSTDVAKGRDGLLFGSLLEAAALSGADLARLVEKIPPGMVVEGLRPRLVAAVADYRLKLNIHDAAATVAAVDRNVLLREVTHRSRRGVRYQQSDLGDGGKELLMKSVMKTSGEERQSESEKSNRTVTILPRSLRTVERQDRYNTLAQSLPMR